MNRELSPELWRRISEKLDGALGLAPDARRAYLEASCEGDEDLLRHVESLLDSDRQAGDFLARPALDAVGLDLGEWMDEGFVAGQRVGPWELVRELGRGGMGVVWLARRAEGDFEQHVALKLIKRGLDTDEILARFRRERQILARLEHPNIGRFLDGGVTGDGRPWFAMEWVQGEPLLAWCEQRRSDLKQRLQLFLDTCAAVQHAHRNLVVHRDLKPSNILVTASGEVKLLDFGIARFLEEEAGSTRTGGRIMTPEYAAPEQALGGAPTTAMDVYGLGGVLYELLAGSRPEKEPQDTGRDIPPPSRRAAPQLARSLKGDLDTIVLMALREEPDRRYSSAEALADDIRRHLAGLPVRARPATRRYRAVKFIRRHRAGVAAAVVGVLALAIFATLQAVQEARTARERDRAERISQFLVELFNVADPDRGRGKDVTAREILDRGAARIERDLAATPDVQAELTHTLGKVYSGMGLYPQSQSFLTRAVEIRSRLFGIDDPRTLRSMGALATSYNLQGHYPEAEKLHREVLAKQRRILGADHPDTLASMHELAAALIGAEQFEAAESLLLEVIPARERVLGPENPDTLRSLNNLSWLYLHTERFDEAVKLVRQIIQKKTRALGPEHPSTLSSIHILASTLNSQGHSAEAEALWRGNYAIQQRTLGNDHPKTMETLQSLAAVEESGGRMSDAERDYLQVLETCRRVQGADHPKTTEVMTLLGGFYLDQRRYREAGDLLRRTLEIRRRVLGPEHPDTLRAINNVAAAEMEEPGRLPDAEALFKETLAAQTRRFGAEGTQITIVLENLGAVCAKGHRLREAEQYYSRALEILRHASGPKAHQTLGVLKEMADLYAGEGDRGQALDYLRQAVEGGFSDVESIQDEPRWNAFRNDAEFKHLLTQAGLNGSSNTGTGP